MQESDFINIFSTAARTVLSSQYYFKIKPNLLYELFLDKQLKIPIQNFNEPKRGSSAFQVDACIFESISSIEFPRVVFELKTNITTHDIITYSAKAGKHKQIYPALRYGLIASEISKIPNRFFVHNEHLDFFIAAKELKRNNLSDLCKKLIESELNFSNDLERIHFGTGKANFFQNNVVFKDFQ